MATRAKKPASNFSKSTTVSVPSTISRKTKIKRYTRNFRRRSPRVNDIPLVVTLTNGLVSMEDTPLYLLAVVDKNLRDSPLLRLPGEIRNMIWEYTMSGHYISIRSLHGVIRRKELPTFFRLPQVCRQIYAETATLRYALNTFIIDGGYWVKRLVPAQRKAINAIALPEVFFYQCFLLPVTNPLRKWFPNLKSIQVMPRTQTNPGQYITFPSQECRKTWRLGELRELGEAWALEQVRMEIPGTIDVIIHEKRYKNGKRVAWPYD